MQQVMLTVLLGPPPSTHAWKNWTHRATQSKWQAENKVRGNAASKKWREKNPRRVVEKVCRYRKMKWDTDPEFKLIASMRNRVSIALKKNQKSHCTRDLLGCSMPDLRTHLEKQFRPGMTWENYGPIWHVDHIRPCTKFNLADPAQQRECFHFTNLQPLFALENLRKGNRQSA